MGRHGWNSGAWRWRIAALLGVGAAALALVLTVLSPLPDSKGSTAGTTPDGDKVHGTPAEPPVRPGPEVGWGFTHTEHSADEGADAAVARARSMLGEQPMPQDQAIMGWGADNPEPDKGLYQFGDLDRRIDFVRKSGGTPVVTLCCAPDWMKGGEPGPDRTDWSQSNLEKAPDPEHFQDFANLAATVAKRYPDVRHFLVWNEFKGFWNESQARWDYEGYTKLYNLVYKALKKVDEDIMVGGPYLVMDSLSPQQTEGTSDTFKGAWGRMDQRIVDAFDYWNEHKAGADFVAVDGSSYTNDDEMLPDEFKATDKFTAVGSWVRQRTGNLPLWWAEYYVEPADGNDERKGWSEPHRVAVHAAALMAMAKGGATSGFYWSPETQKGSSCAGCLWRPTDRASGGGALPLLGLLSRFDDEFGPGTKYRSVTVAEDDVPHVRVLADDKAVLVVNTLNRAISAKVDGKRFQMQGYEVKWLRR
ncbi:xylan 1,4-beta-xylosidase [Streptomyces sp. SID14478]|uniref:GH39 family glycosyl hydrolase n=1 Tax=Streptomyces sp. SID14478 TaxID=2706073 RepID=UPI0013D93849|nr:xylan 1,4-beta-xylosidase [Streptomyces sp. SID14478]NEB78765.1 xylan 1,4-beta-xylosidase [Streptomyces sp. SID14478]NEB82100.1 xylan 1,4-beta-xylosidase [Streptomyces sp. SID14478]